MSFINFLKESLDTDFPPLYHGTSSEELVRTYNFKPKDIYFFRLVNKNPHLHKILANIEYNFSFYLSLFIFFKKRITLFINLIAKSILFDIFYLPTIISSKIYSQTNRRSFNNNLTYIFIFFKMIYIFFGCNFR